MMPWQCWPFYGNCDIKNHSTSVPHMLFFLHACILNHSLYCTDSYLLHIGVCVVGNRSHRHNADSQKIGRHNRMSDKNVCRLRGRQTHLPTLPAKFGGGSCVDARWNYCTIPTLGNPRGGSFRSRPSPNRGKAVLII